MSEAPLRVAFVVEQTLGHRTHSESLHAAVDRSHDIDARWVPVPFEVTGRARALPLWSNWTVRAGTRARLGLRRVTRGWRPDLVYFHTQVSAVLAGRWLRRVPAVISMDATPVQYDSIGAAYHHHAGSPRAERAKWWLNRRALRRARAVIAFSDWTRASLIEHYDVDPARVHVIPPGVDTTVWQPRADRDAVPDEPLRVLFAGNDFVRKGGPELLRAFAGLGLPGVELHVVTGADVESAPGVHVHRGLRPNSEELIRLFQRADIFCMPTHGDALGIVYLEAAACGVPAIGTDVGAVPEAVVEGVTGLLIPPGDVEALTAALRTLLTDPARRRAYGTAARELAERRFDAHRNLARMLAICRQAAQGRP
ncbi:glycosyltransferase family 1 protein [Nocardioides mangrovicus]|uniref:Glycosyltransferase family 1 protein n=1 Tax=Nocardioides mangrovicus TaxID=2478913 RepID=A0A3L8P2S1_9ACTN|nr:glycosyltransferase family 4 protein [Nocardioides mangrovicus]RLV49287.1 glycosyltransferase family 1 protein [Nocardioides mangrovicus]